MFLLFSYKSAGARRLGWLGHLHRMIEKARQIYLYEPRVEGKEEKRKPRKRWEELRLAANSMERCT